MPANVWEADATVAETSQLQAKVSDEKHIATTAQTLFLLTTISYTPGSKNLACYINGVRQNRDTAYTETSNSSVTFTEGLDVGDEVLFVINDYEATAVDADATAVEINGLVTNVEQAFNTLAVETLAALRLLTGTSHGSKARLWGMTSLGDSHVKEYYWDAVSVEAEVIPSIIVPTGITTGRWILQSALVMPLITTVLNPGISIEPLFDSAYFLGLSTEGDGSGGMLYWVVATNKNTADGVDIFDPSVLLADQGTGVGTGCYHRTLETPVKDAFNNTYLGSTPLMNRATGSEGTVHLTNADTYPAASPVGGVVIFAAAGALRARAVAGASVTLIYEDGEISGLNPTATTAELEALADARNTDARKVAGYQVFNTTTNKPVWAVGNATGDVWVDATGATAHTPV